MKPLLLGCYLLLVTAGFAQPAKDALKKFKVKKVAITEIYEDGEPTSTEVYYDNYGNDTATTRFGTTERSTYKYDGKGRITEKRVFSSDDQLRLVYTYTYAPDGSYHSVDKDSQFGLVNHNWYDKNGRLVKTKIPDGTVFTYVYDIKGHLIRKTIVPPGGKAHTTTVANKFDKAGRVISRAFSDGNVTMITYNEKGLVVKEEIASKGSADMAGYKVTVTYKYEF